MSLSKISVGTARIRGQSCPCSAVTGELTVGEAVPVWLGRKLWWRWLRCALDTRKSELDLGRLRILVLNSDPSQGKSLQLYKPEVPICELISPVYLLALIFIILKSLWGAGLYLGLEKRGQHSCRSLRMGKVFLSQVAYELYAIA